MKPGDVVSVTLVVTFIGALFIYSSVTDRPILDVLEDWLSWARKKWL